MNILVLNCGSSSVKAAVVDPDRREPLATMDVARLGGDDETCTLELSTWTEAREVSASDHAEILERGLPKLLDALPEGAEIDAAAHRVVHGGDAFDRPVRIDDEVESNIEELFGLAPLHNPANLAGIRAARGHLDDVLHVAVFDTGFHGTLPSRARNYAIPRDLADAHDIRRYGFHGISHEFVAHRAAEYLETDLRDLRLVTCHLGNGCSTAAVEFGSSVETSMGMTPLEGLVMGTRSGDIDPGALIHLLRREDWDADRLDDLLNRRSGLAGLSGVGNDLRDVQAAAEEGDEDARQAIQVFAHRVRKYVGAYAAVMGGVDAVVFTAGIGENSALMRHRIGQRLEFLGARFDEEKNRAADVGPDRPAVDISTPNARCKLLVVKTDEQRAMAEKAARVAADRDRTAEPERTIPIAVSARHCHLRQQTVEELFGEGYELTPRNSLSQPGQFAARETVRAVGPEGTVENVRILGPVREYDQVEIARTDEFELGVDAPVRCSGAIEQTPGVVLEGPAGRVQLRRGLISPWRHIHMSPEDAEAFGVADRDRVAVAVDTDERDLAFGDVLVRVDPDFELEMHIDTDEANAAGLERRAEGALVATGDTGHLEGRRVSHDGRSET